MKLVRSLTMCGAAQFAVLQPTLAMPEDAAPDTPCGRRQHHRDSGRCRYEDQAPSGRGSPAADGHSFGALRRTGCDQHQRHGEASSPPPMGATPASTVSPSALTLKGVLKLPLRQTTGMVASLLEMAGLDWPVPDFSTLSRRQRTLLVEIPCQPHSRPLHLLIDSTGIKAVSDGEWCRRKHGPSKRRHPQPIHRTRKAPNSACRVIDLCNKAISGRAANF